MLLKNPAKLMLPYSTQSIDESDIEAVVRALKSTNITQGELVEQFESEVAAYLGVKFAITFNSATSALNIAYKIANDKIRDKRAVQGSPKGQSRAKCEFITTPISFCATANMMLENGITPIFCPIDELGNIDTSKICDFISDKTAAIVSVDYGGVSVEVDKILQICKEHNLLFISDSSHAFGGEYKRRKIGQFADMSIFSFHALKPITTIEGGLIATNDEDFYRKARLYRSHGITKQSHWYSDLEYVGYNFRLSDVACALGISQLKRLDSFIKRRDEIARIYNERFRNLGLFSTIEIPQYIKSTHHLYPILLNDSLVCKKEVIFSDLHELGIGVQVHYKPIYQFSLYKDSHTPIPSVDEFYMRELSIPCHQKMSDNDIDFVIENLLKVLQKYA